jgi:hypothetical protein
MSWIVRGRELLMNSYKHLPTLFVGGTLMMGGLTGIVPFLILGTFTTAVYLFFNTLNIFMNSMLPTSNSGSMYYSFKSESGPPELFLNQWLTLSVFVVTYLFCNILSVYNYTTNSAMDESLIANRHAYAISCMVALSVFTLLLLISKGMLDKLPLLMWILSLGAGGGIGYALWNLVSNSGTDLRIGDVFQIRNNMPAVGYTTGAMTTPVVCKAP